MININFGANFTLGFFVSIIGISLYSIRFLNPKISEEKDIFFSTLLLLYSGIMIIHGWRLDPILFFSQILIIFLSISFFSENINLRIQLLKQKKRSIAKRKFINRKVKQYSEPIQDFEKKADENDIEDIFNLFQ